MWASAGVCQRPSRMPVLPRNITSFLQSTVSAHPPESVDHLLELHDTRFVRAAYLALLGRAADVQGHANYLRLLRRGVSKTEIIRVLADSDEGRRANRKLPGLDSLLRTPPEKEPGRIGRALGRLTSWALMPTERRLRAVENGVGALQHETSEQLKHLQWAVTRMESRLALSIERLAAAGQHAQDGAALATARGAGPLILEFEYGRTASPASIGKSGDSRQLALALREVEVFDVRTGASLYKVDMREGGNAPTCMLFGFSSPEPWGTWSSGGKSALALWLKSPARSGVRIEIQTSIFDEAFPSVELTVRSSTGHSGSTTIFSGVERAQVVLDTPVPESARLFFGPAAAEVDPLNVSRSSEMPVVSVIILNYNKPVLSVLSALATAASGIHVPYEMLIVDNGSRADLWKALQELNTVARLVRIPVNRFFGEGNNIGAEDARGEYLVFLNNDAFPSTGCVDEMLMALQDNADGGAACPVFLYPDGRMQEAGAFVRADGSALQRGKFDADFRPEALPRFDEVDYGSAACLMMRADTFAQLGGFNYRYDPAYYEDTDLCMRMKLVGKSVLLARDARCVHIENATTSDKLHNAGANRVVELNKEVFLSVWSPYLKAREEDALPIDILPATAPAVLAGTSQPAAQAATQATFSPFPLTPGGGERYLLSTALALSHFGETRFATADRYSQLRLRNVLTDLGLPTDRFRTEAWAELRPEELQRLVVMGNEVLPRLAPAAAASFFHCQFPFPWSDSDGVDVAAGVAALQQYRKVIVNSEFTRRAYLDAVARHGVSPIVDVVFPPVGTLQLLRPTGLRKPQILSIGRFIDRGHQKRQDVLIAALKAAAPAVRKDWKLVLCGSVPNEPAAKEYFAKLRASVDDSINVEFVISPSRDTLDRLLLESAVYAHATGFGVTSPQDYWKCEHFGITIVEAIVAGCTTFCYGLGGGPEILGKTGGGATFQSVDELAELIGQAGLEGLAFEQRQAAAALFGDAAFLTNMQAALA